MNQPRNPIPQPDPAGIAEYAAAVLGIPMTDWQRNALTDAVIGFGYAVIASSESDDDQTDEKPEAAGADIMQRITGQVEQRPYAPTRIPPSQTPIADGLGTPAADPRNS